jgi:hypothetical protein
MTQRKWESQDSEEPEECEHKKYRKILKNVNTRTGKGKDD